MSIFDQAFKAHSAGHLAEAERGYRATLAAEPRHADAWHLLGVLCRQRGELKKAVEYIRRALKLRGPESAFLTNLGIVLQDLGQGAAAAEALQHAAVLDPQSFQAHFALGNVLQNLKHFEEAAKSFQRATALQPANASVHNNLGNVLQDLGRVGEALDHYRRATQLAPGHARAHYNLGTSLKNLGHFEAAAVSLRTAVTLAPNLQEAHLNLSLVLQDLGQLDDAIRHGRRAVDLNPQDAMAFNNLGAVLRDAGQLEDAMACYAKALDLHPMLAEAHHNRGVALQMMGRENDALECFQQARDLKDEFVEAEQNAALITLRRGDFAAGWTAYGRRWHWRLPDAEWRDFPYPEWRGEEGGGIVVWGEQGLGDKVLYAGMIPDLLARGHSVIMETDPRLIPLFERSFTGVKAVAKANPPDPATARADMRWHSPIGNLGRWLRPDLASFPQRRAYLMADEARQAHYRSLLAGAEARDLVVGLSWSSRNPKIGKSKTLDLAAWAPLLKTPGVRFVDLQYGDTAAERAAVETKLGLCLTHIPDLDLREDIDGVAALTAACDLVISVSNTTVHLAGALGVPTWVLVPAAVGNLWYWMRETDHTPWYPCITIFRQPKLGQWQDVVDALRQRLASLRGTYSKLTKE